jgi:hypothetical protein
MIILASAPFVSTRTRTAWLEAGIEIVGPLPLAVPIMDMVFQSIGVVIDITQEVDAVFAVSEELERQRVPFLYALGGANLPHSEGVFIVNDVPKDIAAIVNALLGQSADLLRH